MRQSTASTVRFARRALIAPGIVFVINGCGGSSSQASAAPTSPPPLPPPIELPQTSPDSLILFDGGHYNYHSITSTYTAFASLLGADGWKFATISGPFQIDVLRRARVLVIANALALRNYPNNWRLPTPSAFTAEEVTLVRQWVEGGGSLLLIADHLPFAGAAEEMAAAFGARFSNGFAFDSLQLRIPQRCLVPTEIHVFRRQTRTLAEHAITIGIDSIGTFTGSAFETDGTSLLTFSSTSVTLLPQAAWEFPLTTPKTSVSGWSQGALKSLGRGRVGIFGEAAMFSEQTCGFDLPMGMNAPIAQQNGRFVVNLLRWLGGRLN